MKFHITTYVCIAMMGINVPSMIDGKTMGLAAFIICGLCGVVCFIFNESRRNLQ